ncbi:MAG TPA: ribulose-phosphate 3-epimerase [Syntrophorhabdaceae bacterium]|nr:ribulose-phosphate 3-epimerase [Syntrophorhabdaceae bacterium]
MNRTLIAPSVLSCNFLKLGEEIKAVESAGADLIHVDVMDGHFVPNITIGPLFVEAMKKVATTPLDVHLMIETPDKYVEEFIAKGADIVTVHAEADKHIHRTLDLIRSSGRKAGVSLNPGTPLSFLETVIHIVDVVLIMTVNPGFGGQAYISSMGDKIRNTRKIIDESGRQVDLQVDGGIKADNVREVVSAGANIVVMGTEIFHSKDYAAKIREVRRNIES